MLVKIIPNTNGAPAGKLAEAEVCFSDDPLAGLKLVGFGAGKAEPVVGGT